MNIELFPHYTTPVGAGVPVAWGNGGNALRSTVDPWFTAWGAPSSLGVSVARVGTAVFLADRMARRPKRILRRRLNLTVHVPAPDELAPALPVLQRLLHWVTGDDWAIRLIADRQDRPTDVEGATQVNRVGLLSGGLDSFCGAVLSHSDRIVYLGHGDAPNVRSTQDDVVTWFVQNGVDLNMKKVWLLPPTRRGKEPSRRSRAAFFVLLAVGLADATGATEIEIPENGFTSLNPPLGPNRGGVWTTRSTHPRTIELFGEVFAAAGVDVGLVNPYETHTKGELVTAASAAESRLTNFVSGLANTQSCAKADGRFYGGRPKENCGLCFACVVRRGGVLTALGSDPTPYLVETLPADNRRALVERRRSDISAIRSIVARGVSRERLLVTGPFGGMAFDDAVDLIDRSLRELAHVPLP